MKIRIDRVRMAMPGENYTYDVVVPVDQLDRKQFNFLILKDGVEHVTFTDATLDPAHRNLRPGMQRYQAYCEHEKTASARAWKLAKQAFPEIPADLPYSSLWVTIPGFNERHKTVFMDVPDGDN